MYWRDGANNAFKGKKAGCLDKRPNGYLLVRWNNLLYQAHRLIFFYHNGYWAENDIDHIDQDKHNNRIENLREVSRQCNARNSIKKSNNKSGVTGVCWVALTQKWQASLVIGGKSKYLGQFEDKSDAVLARHRAEVDAGWPGCNESTCAYKYLAERGLT